MLLYAQLEDAVIARVQAAVARARWAMRWPRLVSYGGQFDDEVFWTQVRRFPAVWTTGGRREGAAADGEEVPLRADAVGDGGSAMCAASARRATAR